MLQINNLIVTLEDKPILNDVSLNVTAGSMHAIMGPNGSGKSTLVSTIMGYPQFEVIAGSAQFNEHNLLELPIEKRARAGIFLACQQPPAIPGVQIFTFLKEAHRMLTGETLSVAEFKERVYAAFDAVKLDHSFIYRNLNEGFSGGEKKRFEVAQFVLFQPKLAIFDEIDSGLDIDALYNITDIINQERKKRPELAIMLITHYNRILNYVTPDYVHIIAQGKIRVSGGPELAVNLEQKGYDGLLLQN